MPADVTSGPEPELWKAKVERWKAKVVRMHGLGRLLAADVAQFLAVHILGGVAYLLAALLVLGWAFKRFPELWNLDLLTGCVKQNTRQFADRRAMKWRKWWKSNQHEIRGDIKELLSPLPWLLLYWLVRIVIVEILIVGLEWQSATEMSSKFQKGVADQMWKSFMRYGVTIWLGNQALSAWEFVYSSEREMFRMRVNITLNVRKKTPSGKYKFQMRTIDECSCNEFLRGLDTILEESKGTAKDKQHESNPLSTHLKGRFIEVPRKQAKQINDQIVNRLSKLFGSTYLQEDMKQDVEQRAYIYALTYEHDEDKTDEEYGHQLVKKFRLLLMEQDRFTEMTNKRRVRAGEWQGSWMESASRSPPTETSPRQRAESLRREVSITNIDALKWESCQYTCAYCRGEGAGDSGEMPRTDSSSCECRSCSATSSARPALGSGSPHLVV